MFMLINWCIYAVIIFMVAGLYGKIDQLSKDVAALRKAQGPATPPEA